jgi:hypothetical protein
MRILAAFALAISLLACTPSAQVSSEQSPQLEVKVAVNANVKVWVNTGSGVYHCPGTRWFGVTKRGEYMTQKQALEKGNRPAYGRYCS